MVGTFISGVAAATDVVGVFVLDAVLKATVLLILACVAAGLLRRASAAVRHRVWCLAFLGLLLLPLLLLALPAWRLPILPNPAGTAVALQANPAVAAESAAPDIEVPAVINGGEEPADAVWPQRASFAPVGASEGPNGDFEAMAEPAASEAPGSVSETIPAASEKAPPIDWQAIVLLTWLIGLIWAVLPVAASPVYKRILIGKAQTVADPERKRLLTELCLSLSVKRPVRVFEVDQPVIPMTWGLLRPIMLLPLAWRTWPVERQRIVLLHELAHVRRWDATSQLLARFACALYWFHPLAWYALVRLRIERESACDDCVLMAGEQASEYARQLVDLARDYRAVAMPAVVAMAQSTNLERRVRAVLDQTRSHLPMSRAAAVAVLICGAILSVVTALVGPANTSEPQGQATVASAETVPGVRETPTQQESASYHGHATAVLFAALCPDGKTLVSASRDGSIMIRPRFGGTVRALSGIEHPSGSASGRRELYCAALSSDGNTLATSGSDNLITLWDLKTVKKLRTLEGHKEAVLSLAISPDGKLLASGGMDRVVRVWDVATGKAVHEGYRGHSFRIQSVAFSPDGETILSGCQGNTVKLWQARAKKYLATFPPDGAALAVACAADDKGLAVGLDHGPITLWNRTPQGELHRRVLEGHHGDVTAIAFSPDGNVLASSGLDGMVKLWDPVTCQRLGRVLAHAGGARCLTFSADGKMLASGGEDLAVKLWDVAKLKDASPPKPSVPPIPEPARSLRPARLESLAIARIKTLGGVFLGKGSGASWSPDASRLAFGKPSEGGIAVLELKTGRRSTLVDGGGDPAWSPKDEKTIAYWRLQGDKQEIWVVNASGGKPRQIVDGFHPAWSRDGTTLYCMQPDGTLKAMPWPPTGDASTVKSIAQEVGALPAVSPDGTQIAYISPTGLHLRNRQSGKVATVPGVPGEGRGAMPGSSAGHEGYIAWSPDGRQLACGGVSNGWRTFGLWVLDPVSAPPMYVVPGPVNRPAWSPDGTKLAFELESRDGNEIWMIETRSLAPLKAFHGAHHPKGKPARLDLKTPFEPKGKLIALDLEGRQDRTSAVAVLGNPLDELPDLPRGEQVLAGVRFKIGDRPIQLGSQYLPQAPDKVEGIAVNRAVARLYVLHASGHGDAYTGVPNRAVIAKYRPLAFRSTAVDGVPYGATIGYYRVRYEDGSRQWIAFAEGEDVLDWTDWADQGETRVPIRGTIAWKDNNESSKERGQPNCLFAGGWQNPHPEKKVAAIDYISAGTSAAPFCVAITVEEPADARATTAPAAATPESGARTMARDSKPDDARLQYRGQVVDPDGKPVAGAKIFLCYWVPGAPPDYVPKPRAVTDKEGRFEFHTTRADFELTARDTWKWAGIVAAADGYGFAVDSSISFETTGKAVEGLSAEALAYMAGRLKNPKRVLRLVRDDVPIQARVATADGKPAAGARIRVNEVWYTDKGDLTAFEKAAEDQKADYYSLRRQVSNLINGPHLAAIVPPVETDKDGRFTLRGVGRERIAQFLVRGPGIETKQLKARTRPGETIVVPHEWRFANRREMKMEETFYGARFDYVAGPSKPVVGRVMDAETGKPIPGVRVSAGQEGTFFRSGSPMIATLADPEGRYRLEGMPIGKENQLNAFPPEDTAYLPAGRWLNTRVAEPSVTHDFRLREGIWVRGRAVDDRTGKPAPGRAQYYAFKDNPHAKSFPEGLRGTIVQERRTDEEGRFEIAVMPGPGLIVFTALDHTRYRRSSGVETITGPTVNMGGDSKVFATTSTYYSASDDHVLRQINPEPGSKPIELTLTLTSGIDVSGFVLDPEGKRLSSYNAYGNIQHGWYSVQGEEFRVEGYYPDRPRDLYFYHPARDLAGFYRLEGKPPKQLVVTLHPAGSVGGRVVDDNGRPLAGVRLFGEGVPSENYGDTSLRLGTDQEGRFLIRGLIPGRQYTLAAARAGIYGYTVAKDVTVETAKTKDLGDVKLQPDSRDARPSPPAPPKQPSKH